MTAIKGCPAVVLVVLAGLVVLAACGTDSSGSVSLAKAPTTTTTTLAETTTTSAPPSAATTSAPPLTATGSGSTAPPATAPDEDLKGFQTEPFRREHGLVVPPVPRLAGIRAAHHPGYDRVVFDLDGPLPGAESVRYVDRVTADGSGDPVAVSGQAFLLVRLEEAQAHTDAGAATVPGRSQPGLPGVKEIVLAGDFEGYVTIALGLAERTPFRVLELAGPTRVVVDVRTAG
jgi:hypothetical protein